MIDYRKLYSELGGPGEVSPEMAFAGKQAERSGAFRAKHPEIFESDHPLAFSDAQNTAQKAKDKSDELQEAFKAASEGNFEDMPKFDQKKLGMQSVGYQQQPWYQMQEIGKGVEDLTMREASRGEKLMHSDIGGKMYKSLEEILKNPNVQFSHSLLGRHEGAGAGITSSPQTPSSNVASYGYTPSVITPSEQQRRQDEETPWWNKPQDTTPDWLKKKREQDALAAANAANKK